MSLGDFGKVVEKVEVVLEKFDGEGPDAVLAERVTIVNDEVVKHEFFEDGELTKTVEGGEDATS